MIDIGRVCMKIAGRDAGKMCVIVNVLDDNYVLIDGQTRRRKCNTEHLELLDKTVEIKKDASNKEVVAALNDLNIECKEKSESAKKEKTTRPKKQKKVSKDQAEKKTAKKPAKKVEVKEAPVEKTAEKKEAPKVDEVKAALAK